MDLREQTQVLQALPPPPPRQAAGPEPGRLGLPLGQVSPLASIAASSSLSRECPQ